MWNKGNLYACPKPAPSPLLPCVRRCSTILCTTLGTPYSSATKPSAHSSDRGTPNCLLPWASAVAMAVVVATLLELEVLPVMVQGLSMGSCTIFFMSSLTCTAALWCCG